MPRRVSLPGADELFRTTGGTALQPSTPRQHAGAEPGAPAAAERLRPVPAPAGAGDSAAAHEGHPEEEQDTGEHDSRDPAAEAAGAAAPAVPAPAGEHSRSAAESAAPAARRQQADRVVAQPNRRGRRASANRRPSGRERHDEKITVYVSAEELMDLEHARLVLRGEHGLAVDRGRIVREAVAVVLADLESRGDASILVRRLRGR